ncbi:MAG: hypothetical protein WCI71_07815, partial [Bacteroidota bacterium]
AMAGCKRPLPAAEAENYLRAFDNNLVQLAGNIGQTMSYQAMWKLCSIKNVPLPYLFSTATPTSKLRNQFEFNRVKGHYQFDGSRNSLIKDAFSDSIIIDFPFQSEIDSTARFIIAEYSEDITILQFMYPLRINACLKIGKRIVMSVQQVGEISHGVPVSGDFKIDFSRYSIRAKLKTNLHRDYGMLKIDMGVSTDEKKQIQCIIRSKITIGEDNSLVYNTLDVDFEMFPVRVKVSVDQESMDRYTKRWMDDFNRNSSITVFDLDRNGFIGNIRLMARPKSDILNFAVIYGDKSYEFLDRFLLSAQKLMNVKL